MPFSNGWVKVYRTIFDSPVVTQSSDHLSIWLYLLTHATPRPYKTFFGGCEVTLQPGQLITSRHSIASCVNSRISESKVQRVLKAFETAQQIEQQTSNKNRLITLTKWDLYQSGEQQNEQPANNRRTTSEQQANTNREKREKNNHFSTEISDIVAYLNEKLGTRYKPTTASTKKHITARLNEGYTLEDFYTVVDAKVLEWFGSEYEKFLRPETLFGAKFEGYLNAANRGGNKQGGIAQFLDNPPTD